MKVLLAVDDSECAMRAVGHVVNHIHDFGEEPEIHLLHVQYQFPGRISAAVDSKVLHEYYEEEGRKALEPARNALSRAGIKFKEIHLTGQKPGETVGAYATQEDFSVLVMGSHGQGALSSLVLGSVARQVLASCDTPALIIR
jgi:Universal stress protein UspA and related nucleotide-binding proteins